MIGSVNVPGASAADIAVINNTLNNKVDKETGKGLSTNDYTTAEKDKLAGLSDITVDTALSTTSTNPVQNKVITSAINAKYTASNATTSARGLVKIGSNISVSSGTISIPTATTSTNGVVKVDSALSSTSTNPVQNKAIYTALAGKVSAVSGKGLSTEDYTTEEKTKLAGLSNIVIPYIYMTVDEYLEITPETNRIYWVINDEGKHGVYKNSRFVEGENMFQSYSSILSLVRHGTFANYYSLGDQLIVKYKGNDTLWDIVAIDVAIPADTSKTHSVTLVSHDCLENLMFDNKEPQNSKYYNRQQYGYNRYLYSNVRQWLNSSATANNWYSNQHSKDNAPPYATTKAGFMSYFDSDFLALIGKTKITTAKPTTDGGGYEEIADEYFYLASRTEVGACDEGDISEGTLFPYFNDKSNKVKNYNGSPVKWWLRSPVSDYKAREITESGGYYTSGAGTLVSDSLGIVPVCNII